MKALVPFYVATGVLAVGLTLFAGYRALHSDGLNFCPMALDYIRFDHGRIGYEKAEASWRRFAAYYNCERRDP